jgi:hypothetical protein
MSISDDLLTKIVERTPLTFLVIGTALIVTAATGGWQTIHLSVNSQPWRIVLSAFGGVLIAVAIYLVLGETGPSADISMVTPQNNDVLSPPIKVSGRCKRIPKGFELWVFSISGTGTAAKYWPQDCSDVRDETWSVEVFPGQWKPGDRRKYGVFLVGADGQALIHYFKAAGHELSARGAQGWPPISELTRDTIQYGPTREIGLK